MNANEGVAITLSKIALMVVGTSVWKALHATIRAAAVAHLVQSRQDAAQGKILFYTVTYRSRYLRNGDSQRLSQILGAVTAVTSLSRGVL